MRRLVMTRYRIVKVLLPVSVQIGLLMASPEVSCIVILVSYSVMGAWLVHNMLT